MGEVLAWPVVRREEIVRAAAPGGASDREPPFRALRVKGWATSGVRVPRRRDGRLAGQLVMYCSLNVDAARFARLGDALAAARAARGAERLEAGPGFAQLKDLLRGLGEEQQAAVLDGEVPQGEQGAQLRILLESLAQEVARITADLPYPHDRFAGEVSERRGDSVVVSATDGTRMAVPLWLVQAVHRDQVGDRLIVISVRLDDRQALVQVLPGIAVPPQRAVAEPTETFTPFGRGRRALEVSREDTALLRGIPQPLRVLVPVTVEG
ncbi:MAG: hypothetical protein QG671_2087 [Actinomycetota bacterium]|nr:hypothetical protein [Actinomycetota bacterium]